jgi:epoxyqueuosine reductase
MNITSSAIKAQAIALGFHKIGITSVAGHNDQQAADRLKTWMTLGYHADMAWMAAPKRQNIRDCLPDVRSLICVALNYYCDPPRPESKESGKNYGKISRYAWGKDYHRVLQKKLKALTQWLHGQDARVQTRFYVDTGPVQDKVWAERAGLGWIGKHGNLITRDYGSWVFLGEILINIDLEPDRPHTQHCGTCTRCLDACPTGAIPAPFQVDAGRCIAYHTIENRAESLPAAIASQLNGWVAGCDICQEVCPWNQRFAQETDITDFHPYSWNIAPLLSELAEISQQDWDHRFRASALRRIKPEMLRRNARASLE